MDCNVIKDLLPLYIDNCCSEESAKLVEEHMEKCSDCKCAYESMKEMPLVDAVTEQVPMKLMRINDWKASIMQSILLFIAFGIITVGVAFEAELPSGLLNGFWAFSLVVPATGFLLSLTNWYFVRLYKNRKVFSTSCSLINLGITLAAYVWTISHYEMAASIIESVILGSQYYVVLMGNGFVLMVIFIILSKGLSEKYALMLGKE